MAVKEIEITRIDILAKKIQQKKDFVATESPLHIFVDQTRYVSILCSPINLKKLAIGHLLSEGVLTCLEEMQETSLEANGICKVKLKPEIDVKKRLALVQPFSRLIVSACGSADYWPLFKLIDRLNLPKIPFKWQLNAKTILESVKQLNLLAETFRKTGAVHVAALFKNNGQLIAYAEDIGRHNAIDKVIGISALKKFDFQKCFLVSSGRLTGDIVLKAARMQIPIIASMAAAINSGIEVAEQAGITLIGFARGNRFNVYTFPERVNLDS